MSASAPHHAVVALLASTAAASCAHLAIAALAQPIGTLDIAAAAAAEAEAGHAHAAAADHSLAALMHAAGRREFARQAHVFHRTHVRSRNRDFCLLSGLDTVTSLIDIVADFLACCRACSLCFPERVPRMFSAFFELHPCVFLSHLEATPRPVFSLNAAYMTLLICLRAPTLLADAGALG
jgi:hypothetical protein